MSYHFRNDEYPLGQNITVNNVASLSSCLSGFLWPSLKPNLARVTDNLWLGLGLSLVSLEVRLFRIRIGLALFLACNWPGLSCGLDNTIGHTFSNAMAMGKMRTADLWIG